MGLAQPDEDLRRLLRDGLGLVDEDGVAAASLPGGRDLQGQVRDLDGGISGRAEEAGGLDEEVLQEKHSQFSRHWLLKRCCSSWQSCSRCVMSAN